jgi:hypothetical protein
VSNGDTHGAAGRRRWRLRNGSRRPGPGS